MTSDFENDEIDDSTFPIDFTDDTANLDQYGVWVKKGPRDISNSSIDKEQLEKTDVSLKETVDLPEMEKVLDDENLQENSDIPELPDFDDSVEAIADDTISVESFLSEPEETQPTDDTIQEIPDSYDLKTPEVVFEELTEADFSVKKLDTANFDTTLVPQKNEQESETKENEDTSLQSTEKSNVASVKDTNDIEDISIDDFFNDETKVPDIKKTHTETENIPEKTIPSESILEENSILDTDASLTDSDLSFDADFSDFLDDLNSGEIGSEDSIAAITSEHIQGSNATGDDLDSFIDSFNESGGRSKAENEKLFDDVEPLDIDLEFDEKFIESEAKILSNGSPVSDSEFYSPDFGVEVIDETENISVDDFMSDIPEIPEIHDSHKSGMSLEITNEFDDLLQSLEDSPAPIAQEESEKSVEPQKKEYNLTVTEDEGYDTVAPTVAEADNDSDITVSLFSSDEKNTKNQKEVMNKIADDQLRDNTSSVNEKKTVETDRSTGEAENLDIPSIRDYNTETNCDNEMEITEERVIPDFDDISAVEADLVSSAPETGDANVITNDKSTELLMRIADELSSIKQEISTLKTEITSYKEEAGQGEIKSSQKENSELQDNSGFFSDDDTDETIALTGDELNNILITADFTEEKNEENAEIPTEPEVEVDKEAVIASESMQEADISPEETVAPEKAVSFEDTIATDDLISSVEDVSSEEKIQEDAVKDENIIDATEEITSDNITSDVSAIEMGTDEQLTEFKEAVDAFGDEQLEIPETLPDSIGEWDSETDEIPVTHVTQLEEDTSYLEGDNDNAEPELDNVAIEEPDLEIIDFDEEKLEEPELEEFNLDLADIDSEFPAEQEVAKNSEMAEVEESISDEQTNMPENVEPVPDATIKNDTMIDDISVADEIKPHADGEEKESETIEEEPTLHVEAENESNKAEADSQTKIASLPSDLKEEIKSVLSYMDQLLESLPEDKIEEFAKSDHFEVYKRLFEELGIS